MVTFSEVRKEDLNEDVDEIIEIEGAPLAMKRPEEVENIISNWIWGFPFPYTEISGYCPDFDVRNEMNELRLMIYKGSTDIGIPYANSTSRILDPIYSGQLDLTFSLTESFPGGGGVVTLFNRYFKDWIQFMATSKKVEFEWKTTASALLSLEIDKPVRVYDVFVLIESIKARLAPTGWRFTVTGMVKN